MIKNNKWLLLVALTMMACSDDDAVVVNDTADGMPLTAGSADFSKFVSLGNSLTAGFSDNALFIAGQEGSYPNIMASQFALVGGGDFKIPYMNDNIGGFVGGNPAFGPRFYLLPPSTPGGSPSPSPVPEIPTTNPTTVIAGPFNNFGVPGAKSFHLAFPGYGSLNPYFGRFASSPSTTILADAVAQNPTFFSLWIGNNDVLSYALSGGTGTNQAGNLNPATYGNNDITDPNVFANVYSTLVNGLTANGAKGVVANLPYVNTIPYFTTVPYNAVPLNAAQVSALNAGYTAYNNGLLFAASNGLLTSDEVERRTINFTVGQNPVVIVDSYLTNLSAFGIPSYRQATAQDFILLLSGGISIQAHLAAGNGSQFPLADNWVLSKDEVAELKIATDAFNQSIRDIATEKGLAFVDANSLLNQVANGGITSNNYTISSAYLTGGAFSIDGVHPSPRGYALIANEFLKAVNATYGSNFKGVDVSNYRIMFPKSSADF